MRFDFTSLKEEFNMNAIAPILKFLPEASQALLNAIRFRAGAAPALVLSAALLLGCSHTHAVAAEGLNYSITDHGPLWEKVHDNLPEIYDDEMFGDIQVNSFLGLAQADLNKDSNEEIFAYVVPEPDWIHEGYPGNLHAIFKVNNDGTLTRIWTGTANGLRLGENYTNGMRNIEILTDIHGKNAVTYKWNGTTYMPSP